MPAEVRAVSIESQIAGIMLWVVALGWALPAPWLMWWVIVRGRLPVLPLIGEPNGGPFYRRASRGTFVVLLGLSLALGVAQAWAGWLLWNGQQLGAVLQFSLLPIEALFWYGFALPIPPVLAVVRIVLVVLAWPLLI
jgi:hypothetical protein